MDNCRLLTQTQVVLTDLLKFTMYAFRVIAINKAGNSPEAYTLKRTLEDCNSFFGGWNSLQLLFSLLDPERAPTHVTCRSATKSIKVEWNPPKKDFVNGIMKNYKIIYFSTNQHREPDHEESSIITKHMLNNLLPNTNYTIQVKAVNNKGPGPPSESVHCTTNEASPSAPSMTVMFK